MFDNLERVTLVRTTNGWECKVVTIVYLDPWRPRDQELQKFLADGWREDD